eukprot:TRINITY_DN3561_c0_g1_i4.p1 TRINITY_DN3561_c0_g1~~TRINITY_DN3561_c0_g1_i4.p1  ORF type:complete len:2107 (+),score=771.02 TRINITY_DN3561_c0_g1_i4:50-6370(+)
MSARVPLGELAVQGDDAPRPPKRLRELLAEERARCGRLEEEVETWQQTSDNLREQNVELLQELLFLRNAFEELLLSMDVEVPQDVRDALSHVAQRAATPAGQRAARPLLESRQHDGAAEAVALRTAFATACATLQRECEVLTAIADPLTPMPAQTPCEDGALSPRTPAFGGHQSGFDVLNWGGAATPRIGGDASTDAARLERLARQLGERVRGLAAACGVRRDTDVQQQRYAERQLAEAQQRLADVEKCAEEDGRRAREAEEREEALRDENSALRARVAEVVAADIRPQRRPAGAAHTVGTHMPRRAAAVSGICRRMAEATQVALQRTEMLRMEVEDLRTRLQGRPRAAAADDAPALLQRLHALADLAAAAFEDMQDGRRRSQLRSAPPPNLSAAATAGANGGASPGSWLLSLPRASTTTPPQPAPAGAPSTMCVSPPSAEWCVRPLGGASPSPSPRPSPRRSLRLDTPSMPREELPGGVPTAAALAAAEAAVAALYRVVPVVAGRAAAADAVPAARRELEAAERRADAAQAEADQLRSAAAAAATRHEAEIRALQSAAEADSQLKEKLRRAEEAMAASDRQLKEAQSTSGRAQQPADACGEEELEVMWSQLGKALDDVERLKAALAEAGEEEQRLREELREQREEKEMDSAVTEIDRQRATEAARKAEQRLAEALADLDQLREADGRLRDELRALKDAGPDADARTRAEQRLREALSDAESMRQQLSAAAELTRQLRGEAAALKDAAAHSDRLRESLDAELRAAREDEAERVRQRSAAADRERLLRGEIAELKAAAGSTGEAVVKQLREEMDALKAAEQRLRAAAADRDRALRAQDEAEQRLHARTSALREAEARADAAASERRAAVAAADRLRCELDAVAGAERQLQGQASALLEAEARAEAAASARAAAEADADRMRREVEAAAETTRVLRADAAALRSTAEEAEQRLAGAELRLGQAEGSKQLLRDEARAAELRLREALSDVDRLRAAAAGTERQLHQLRGEVAVLQDRERLAAGADVDALRNELQALRERDRQAAGAEQSLRAALQNAAVVAQQLRSARAEVDSVRAAGAALQARADADAIRELVAREAAARADATLSALLALHRHGAQCGRGASPSAAAALQLAQRAALIACKCEHNAAAALQGKAVHSSAVEEIAALRSELGRWVQPPAAAALPDRLRELQLSLLLESERSARREIAHRRSAFGAEVMAAAALSLSALADAKTRVRLEEAYGRAAAAEGHAKAATAEAEGRSVVAAAERAERWDASCSWAAALRLLSQVSRSTDAMTPPRAPADCAADALRQRAARGGPTDQTTTRDAATDVTPPPGPLAARVCDAATGWSPQTPSGRFACCVHPPPSAVDAPPILVPADDSPPTRSSAAGASPPPPSRDGAAPAPWPVGGGGAVTLDAASGASPPPQAVSCPHAQTRDVAAGASPRGAATTALPPAAPTGLSPATGRASTPAPQPVSRNSLAPGWAGLRPPAPRRADSATGASPPPAPAQTRDRATGASPPPASDRANLRMARGSETGGSPPPAPAQTSGGFTQDSATGASPPSSTVAGRADLRTVRDSATGASPPPRDAATGSLPPPAPRTARDSATGASPPPASRDTATGPSPPSAPGPTARDSATGASPPPAPAQAAGSFTRDSAAGPPAWRDAATGSSPPPAAGPTDPRTRDSATGASPPPLSQTGGGVARASATGASPPEGAVQDAAAGVSPASPSLVCVAADAWPPPSSPPAPAHLPPPALHEQASWRRVLALGEVPTPPSKDAAAAAVPTPPSKDAAAAAVPTPPPGDAAAAARAGTATTPAAADQWFAPPAAAPGSRPDGGVPPSELLPAGVEPALVDVVRPLLSATALPDSPIQDAGCGESPTVWFPTRLVSASTSTDAPAQCDAAVQPDRSAECARGGGGCTGMHTKVSIECCYPSELPDGVEGGVRAALRGSAAALLGVGQRCCACPPHPGTCPACGAQRYAEEAADRHRRMLRTELAQARADAEATARAERRRAEQDRLGADTQRAELVSRLRSLQRTVHWKVGDGAAKPKPPAPGLGRAPAIAGPQRYSGASTLAYHGAGLPPPPPRLNAVPGRRSSASAPAARR